MTAIFELTCWHQLYFSSVRYHTEDGMPLAIAPLTSPLVEKRTLSAKTQRGCAIAQKHPLGQASIHQGHASFYCKRIHPGLM